MEVSGRQPGGAEGAQQRFKQVQAELSNANRARVRRARQVLQTLAAQRLQRQRSANRAAAESAREKGEAAIRNQDQPHVDPQAIDRLNQAARTEAAEIEQRTEKFRSEARESVGERDRVELSESARALATRMDGAREANLQELRKAHRRGNLNTPERIAKAAQRLLEG